MALDARDDHGGRQHARAAVPLTGANDDCNGLVRLIGDRRLVLVGEASHVHADADELTKWLSGAPHPPETASMVHGEPEASAALHDGVATELGWNTVVPSFAERVRLD